MSLRVCDLTAHYFYEQGNLRKNAQVESSKFVAVTLSSKERILALVKAVLFTIGFVFSYYRQACTEAFRQGLGGRRFIQLPSMPFSSESFDPKKASEDISSSKPASVNNSHVLETKSPRRVTASLNLFPAEPEIDLHGFFALHGDDSDEEGQDSILPLAEPSAQEVGTASEDASLLQVGVAETQARHQSSPVPSSLAQPLNASASSTDLIERSSPSSVEGDHILRSALASDPVSSPLLAEQAARAASSLHEAIVSPEAITHQDSPITPLLSFSPDNANASALDSTGTFSPGPEEEAELPSPVRMTASPPLFPASAPSSMSHSHISSFVQRDQYLLATLRRHSEVPFNRALPIGTSVRDRASHFEALSQRTPSTNPQPPSAVSITTLPPASPAIEEQPSDTSGAISLSSRTAHDPDVCSNRSPTSAEGLAHSDASEQLQVLAPNGNTSTSLTAPVPSTMPAVSRWPVSVRATLSWLHPSSLFSRSQQPHPPTENTAGSEAALMSPTKGSLPSSRSIEHRSAAETADVSALAIDPRLTALQAATPSLSNRLWAPVVWVTDAYNRLPDTKTLSKWLHVGVRTVGLGLKAKACMDDLNIMSNRIAASKDQFEYCLNLAHLFVYSADRSLEFRDYLNHPDVRQFIPENIAAFLDHPVFHLLAPQDIEDLWDIVETLPLWQEQYVEGKESLLAFIANSLRLLKGNAIAGAAPESRLTKFSKSLPNIDKWIVAQTAAPLAEKILSRFNINPLLGPELSLKTTRVAAQVSTAVITRLPIAQDYTDYYLLPPLESLLTLSSGAQTVIEQHLRSSDTEDTEHAKKIAAYIEEGFTNMRTAQDKKAAILTIIVSALSTTQEVLRATPADTNYGSFLETTRRLGLMTAGRMAATVHNRALAPTVILLGLKALSKPLKWIPTNITQVMGRWAAAPAAMTLSCASDVSSLSRSMGWSKHVQVLTDGVFGVLHPERLPKDLLSRLLKTMYYETGYEEPSCQSVRAPFKWMEEGTLLTDALFAGGNAACKALFGVEPVPNPALRDKCPAYIYGSEFTSPAMRPVLPCRALNTAGLFATRTLGMTLSCVTDIAQGALSLTGLTKEPSDVCTEMRKEVSWMPSTSTIILTLTALLLLHQTLRLYNLYTQTEEAVIAPAAVEVPQQRARQMLHRAGDIARQTRRQHQERGCFARMKGKVSWKRSHR